MQTEILPGTIKPNGKPRRPVLVTTAHKGVFFGYLASNVTKERITLTRVRNVVFFDAATKGFLGLAQNGPTSACRIGPAVVEKSTIFDITLVSTVSEEAVKRFEEAPWSR